MFLCDIDATTFSASMKFSSIEKSPKLGRLPEYSDDVNRGLAKLYFDSCTIRPQNV